MPIDAYYAKIIPSIIYQGLAITLCITLCVGRGQIIVQQGLASKGVLQIDLLPIHRAHAV